MPNEGNTSLIFEFICVLPWFGVRVRISFHWSVHVIGEFLYLRWCNKTPPTYFECEHLRKYQRYNHVKRIKTFCVSIYNFICNNFIQNNFELVKKCRVVTKILPGLSDFFSSLRNKNPWGKILLKKQNSLKSEHYIWTKPTYLDRLSSVPRLFLECLLRSDLLRPLTVNRNLHCLFLFGNELNDIKKNMIYLTYWAADFLIHSIKMQ